MASLISDIETQVRRSPLLETTASFWTSAELTDWIIAGIKDLWRSIVDLKQEHYLKIDDTNVYLPASTSTLAGVPADVHKIYLIEPRDVTSSSSTGGLEFIPRDWNSEDMKQARTRGSVTPQNDEIFYAITGQGSPVGPPVIYIAPQVDTAVNLTFSYVPTLQPLASSSPVPIPGEPDHALVAWAAAYGLAKEREDREPHPGWIATYATEKEHLLQSLGQRQYQEPEYVRRIFKDYWD